MSRGSFATVLWEGSPGVRRQGDGRIQPRRLAPRLQALVPLSEFAFLSPGSALLTPGGAVFCLDLPPRLHLLLIEQVGMMDVAEPPPVFRNCFRQDRARFPFSGHGLARYGHTPPQLRLLFGYRSFWLLWWLLMMTGLAFRREPPDPRTAYLRLIGASNYPRRNREMWEGREEVREGQSCLDSPVAHRFAHTRKGAPRVLHTVFQKSRGPKHNSPRRLSRAVWTPSASWANAVTEPCLRSGLLFGRPNVTPR